MTNQNNQQNPAAMDKVLENWRSKYNKAVLQFKSLSQEAQEEMEEDLTTFGDEVNDLFSQIRNMSNHTRSAFNEFDKELTDAFDKFEEKLKESINQKA